MIPPFLVPLSYCFVNLKPQAVGNPFPDIQENDIFFIVNLALIRRQ